MRRRRSGGRPRGNYAVVGSKVTQAIIDLRRSGKTLKQVAALSGYGLPVVGRILSRHPEVDPVLNGWIEFKGRIVGDASSRRN